MAAGMTVEDLLVDYPDLEREDVLPALEYGALAVGGRLPLGGLTWARSWADLHLFPDSTPPSPTASKGPSGPHFG